MIDIEKWKNRIENELTLSKDLCLKEMRLNFTRNDLIELNVLLGSVSEIRNKAIEEFAEKAMKQFTELDLKDNLATVTDCKIILRDLAESMKGEKE